MIKEISREEYIKRFGKSISTRLLSVKEIREIKDDFNEVNRLLNNGWILIGVMSNSGNVIHAMGRVH